jgi:hypothetical protein
MSQEFNYPSSAVNIGLTKVCIIASNVTPDTDTQCESHECKRALIKAMHENTGLAQLNIGATAVGDIYYPLSKDESVSLPLTNTDQIHVSFAVGAESVSVLYSN